MIPAFSTCRFGARARFTSMRTRPVGLLRRADIRELRDRRGSFVQI